jgi:predicted MPP superfamily phosphohydrolase
MKRRRPLRNLVWLSDLHLDFCDDEQGAALLRRIAALKPDAVLLGGDIAESPAIERHLRAMEQALSAPIYFVLGNHDFYRSGIGEVRRRLAALCDESERLVYLTGGEIVALDQGVCLLGHDGWADGRFGDHSRSDVEMNDFHLIADLANLSSRARLKRMRALAGEAAEALCRKLPEAFEQREQVVFLTHVPPFAEAAWHDGVTCGPDWLPFFSSRAAGEAMLEIMRERPDKRLLVLCGHTHGSGSYRPIPNLLVLTAPARYGAPDIAGVLTITEDGVDVETNPSDYGAR